MSAVNFHQSEDCDLLIIASKAIFLNELVQKSENVGIIQLYKRSANVLAIEEKRDGRKYDKEAKTLIFTDEYEKLLHRVLEKVSLEFKKMILHGNFSDAFNLLRLLEEPMAQFFNHVIVNDENEKLRENRLMLLSQIRALFAQVADFSMIEV